MEDAVIIRAWSSRSTPRLFEPVIVVQSAGGPKRRSDDQKVVEEVVSTRGIGEFPFLWISISLSKFHDGDQTIWVIYNDWCYDGVVAKTRFVVLLENSVVGDMIEPLLPIVAGCHSEMLDRRVL